MENYDLCGKIIMWYRILTLPDFPVTLGHPAWLQFCKVGQSLAGVSFICRHLYFSSWLRYLFTWGLILECSLGSCMLPASWDTNWTENLLLPHEPGQRFIAILHLSICHQPHLSWHVSKVECTVCKYWHSHYECESQKECEQVVDELPTNNQVCIILVVELCRHDDCCWMQSPSVVSHMVLLAPLLTIFLATPRTAPPLSSAEADLWGPKFCFVRSLRSLLSRVCILGDISWLHINLDWNFYFWEYRKRGTIFLTPHAIHS